MTPEIFRQRYPHGGLISELAAIEHGQFIVRAWIEIEGATIASGLAAAPSVEQAEDQARIRALNLFALGTHPVVSHAAPPAPVHPHPVVAPPSPAPVMPSPAPVANPVPSPVPTPQPTPPSFTLDMPLSEPPEPEPELPSMTDEPLELTLTAPPITEPDENLDFSDIIARTDVELKRLGWGSEQGRNYLLETYGKRSRQLLSDGELLEFLRHLEAQPTP